jgi:TolA-binding protein
MRLRIALFSSAMLLVAAPALAQDANVEGRVVKLEKEMRAVQRQVFPNGAGKFFEPEIKPADGKPATITSSSSAVSDLLARVDALETQLASLTGQVEQHGNSMRSMDTRMKALEADLRAQSAPAVSVAPATTTTQIAVKATPKPVPAVVAAAAKPSAARTTAVAKIERSATGDAFEDAYNYGYRLWEAKFYPEAQVTLEETVKKHPKHKRLSYARNLLGRAWLDDKKPATAVKIFYDNYKNEPRGDRAPESLFFLGSALTDLGKTAEACEAFGELAKAYPDAATGRLTDRLASGRSRAKCK